VTAAACSSSSPPRYCSVGLHQTTVCLESVMISWSPQVLAVYYISLDCYIFSSALSHCSSSVKYGKTELIKSFHQLNSPAMSAPAAAAAAAAAAAGRLDLILTYTNTTDNVRKRSIQ